MLQKIKNLIMAAALPLAIAAPLVLAPAAHAATCDNIKSSLTDGINSATGDTSACGDTGSSGTGGIQTIAQKIVNLLSLIVGIVAVIMIIVGGFRYIASGGASDKVSGAKNTLIYAIVGLIIVALAQFIVRFVLGNVGA